MGISASIIGGLGDFVAKVTNKGQLIVAPYDYDEVVFFELATANAAYSFYPPKGNYNFIITGIVGYADKQVGTTTGATVIVYEAVAPETAVVDKTLFQIEMASVSNIVLLPLNIKVNEGRFVNAKTDDDDIHMSIMGYYIPSAE
mgnify:CR=1 FL=1